MAQGSLPDRRPEGDDLAEQFLGQLGGEEIFQEPLAADPVRPRRVGQDLTISRPWLNRHDQGSTVRYKTKPRDVPDSVCLPEQPCLSGSLSGLLGSA